MKIVQIVPGSGGTFYCQNCMRESALVKAMRDLGHDVIMVPMYLPTFTDEPGISRGVPVFFGGISVYLREKVRWLRRMPRGLAAVLDAPWLLGWAARQSGSTKPGELVDMTLSMLRGEEGNQAEEIHRMISWLAESEKPDLIHVASILLLGLARPLKERLGVPLVCAAQDEDMWIDAIPAPHNERCWDAMRERTGDVDLFVSVSRYYSERIRAKLRLTPDQMKTVYLGISLDGMGPAPVPPNPPVIGYLSQVKPSLGLGLLVDAFLELKRDPALQALRLKVTGGVVGVDKRFLAQQQAKISSAGFAGDAEFLPEFDRPSRIHFLKSLSVLSVPVPGGEAFGTYILEALACGVPVVQPRAGAFPELVELTGGGVLCNPGDASDLARKLRDLLLDPGRASQLGRQGRDVVLQKFSIGRMAQEMSDLYRSVLAKRR